MLAYKKLQQRKKANSEWLTGEGVHINFVDLRFEREPFVGFGKGRRQDVS